MTDTNQTSAAECLAGLPLDDGVPDMAVIDEMGRTGGSFFRALGRAAEFADTDNRQILIRLIKENWPERWANYRNLAISRARQQTEQPD